WRIDRRTCQPRSCRSGSERGRERLDLRTAYGGRGGAGRDDIVAGSLHANGPARQLRERGDDACSQTGKVIYREEEDSQIRRKIPRLARFRLGQTRSAW